MKQDFICPFCHQKLGVENCPSEKEKSFSCFSCKLPHSGLSKVYIDFLFINDQYQLYRYELRNKLIISSYPDIKKTYYRETGQNDILIDNNFLTLEQLKEKLELMEFYS